MRRPEPAMFRKLLSAGCRPVADYERDAGQGVRQVIHRWVQPSIQPALVIDLVDNAYHVDAVLSEIRRLRELEKSHPVVITGPIDPRVVYRIEVRSNRRSSHIAQREFLVPTEGDLLHEQLSLSYLQYPWYPGDDEQSAALI